MADLLYPDLSGNGKGVVDLDTVLRVYEMAPVGLTATAISDDRIPIQNAMDAMKLLGGGRVVLPPGTYRITDADLDGPVLVVQDKVELDLNGSTVNFYLNQGNSRGFVLKSFAHLTNGTVNVFSMVSTASVQGVVHSPVSVGELYGNNLARTSIYENCYGWKITKLTLSSNKNVLSNGNYYGSAAIGVIGNSHHGVIDQIKIPDSAFLNGLVLCDWGVVGLLRSQPIDGDTVLNNMNSNRARFDAGEAWASIPHNISITNIEAGKMTRAYTTQDTGCFGVRFSACYNMRASNVHVEELTNSLAVNHAGDLGEEFALVAEKGLITNGITFENMSCAKQRINSAIITDAYGDNLANAIAVGYAALTVARLTTDIVFDNIWAVGSGDAAAPMGARVRDQVGGMFRNITMTSFKNGWNVDQRVDNFTVDNVKSYKSREDGGLIHHATFPPENIVVINPTSTESGQDNTFGDPAGVHIGTSKRTRILFGTFGKAVETTQKFGIRIGLGGELATVVYPEIISFSAGGGNFYDQRADEKILHRSIA